MRRILVAFIAVFLVASCGGSGGGNLPTGDYNGYYYISSTTGDCGSFGDVKGMKGTDTNGEVVLSYDAKSTDTSASFRYAGATCAEPMVYDAFGSISCASCAENSTRSQISFSECPLVDGGADCSVTLKKCTSGFCGSYVYTTAGDCGGITSGETIYFADDGAGSFGGSVSDGLVEFTYDTSSKACIDSTITISGQDPITCDACTISSYGQSVQISFGTCVLTFDILI